MFRDLARTAVALIALTSALAHSADDAIAPPPLVRGFVAGLAVDADGNRYLAGSFYEARDCNPGIGADVKTPAGWGDLFITRFNADGAYAWTQNVGVANGSTFASSVAVANGIVYATGGQYTWDDLTYISTNNAIVVALDAASGQLKKDFGTEGTASLSNKSGAMGLALAVSGNAVYASGEVFPDWSNYAAVDPIADPGFPTWQPKSNTFVWALDAISGASIAGFGEKGVAILDAIEGHNSGRGIAVSGDAVFIGGTLFDYGWPAIYTGADGQVPGINGPPTSGDPATGGLKADDDSAPNFVPYYYGTQNGFIASLNATTGAFNTGFAKAGIKRFGEKNSATGNGLAVSGGVAYLTGGLTKLPALLPDGSIDFTKQNGFAYYPSADIYVLAVDAVSGAEIAGFGSNGVATFGRQFDDQGVALAADSGTLYVTGGYSNLTAIGGYFYPLAEDGAGAAPPQNGPVAGGPPKPLNDPAASSRKGPSDGSPVNAFGLPNNLPGSTTGVLAPDASPSFWYGGYGVTDAFVLALDAATGAPKASFSGDGLQTFGGSSSDGGIGIAIYKENVILAGYGFSSDAGLGGLGKIDATDWYAFLLTLDTATGGGGDAETNIAPIVRAGDPQTVKLPELKRDGGYKDAGYYYNDYQAWLYPQILDDGLPNPPGTVTVKWSKVSGPGTVKFDDETSAYTGVSFSTEGTYVLRIDVSDSVLSANDTTTITVAKNKAPIIDSPPTALPNPAAVGENVIFSAAAHDPDAGDYLYYWWDFGDDCYGWDASASHAYFAPGTYSAILHVSDGWDDTAAKIKVTITGDPVFNIDGLQFTVDFAGKKRSTLRVKGSVGGLPKSFDPTGATVNLNAGGAVADFTLDKKGRGKNAQGTFALQRDRKGWKYSAKLNSAAIETGTVPAASNALGIDNVTVKNERASVPVSLNIAGVNFTGNKTVEYSCVKDMAKGK